MKSFSISLRQAKLISFGCFVGSLLLTSWIPVAAQEAAKPPGRDYRSKNGMLLVFGYEMEKTRADAILQTQDMTHHVKIVVGKLEALTQAKGAVHSSCAAQVLKPGQGNSLNMGSFSLTIDTVFAVSGDDITATIQRTDKASGTESTVSANLKFGEYAFIGTVPDVKSGKDLLLFIRCLIHHP